MFKRHKIRTSLIIAIILGIGVYFTNEQPKEEATAEGLQLTFVDVGQGDAIFMETLNGETWLIDGGEDDDAQTELLPFLDAQAVDTVDYAVVTHYHNDHIGGIFQLLKAGRIKTLILPDYKPDNKAKTGLLKNAEAAHTSVLDVSAGDVLESEDKNLKISVLHPEKGGFDRDNENSNSTVLKVEYFKTTALLVGDLEEDAEEVLLPEYDLEVDILKVGHHGSGTSTGKTFLAEVNPTYGIISAGEGNSYGHPHYETLSKLEYDDVRVYRTDHDGDITFILNENGVAKITTEE